MMVPRCGFISLVFWAVISPWGYIPGNPPPVPYNRPYPATIRLITHSFPHMPYKPLQFLRWYNSMATDVGTQLLLSIA